LYRRGVAAGKFACAEDRYSLQQKAS